MTDEQKLKAARAFARAVGATIDRQDEITENSGFIVRLGVCIIGDNGTREYPVFNCPTPEKAAVTACVETAKASDRMMATAKLVYANSDLIFGRL